MRTSFTTRQFKDAIRNGPSTWPGGYPLYFITSDGAAISFEAAKENARLILASIRGNMDDGWQVVGVDVNWEDPDLFCDHTGNRIESAYAEN